MVPYVKHIHVKNFKSLADCSVSLGEFTVLVGPNGAGKSNFIDVLAFVQDALFNSLDMAFRNRGGIAAVRRKSGGHPTHILVDLAIQLDAETEARYGFEIAAKPTEQFRIAAEWCEIGSGKIRKHGFRVAHGVFQEDIPGIKAKIPKDRFALYAASATEEFRVVYDFLTAIRYYSIAPDQIRSLQDADQGDFLRRNGSNAAAVLKRLHADDGNRTRYDRICRILSRVVSDIESVEYSQRGEKETIQFKQKVGLPHTWRFDALNMSDGTLRVLGLLLAVYQSSRNTVILIEEPEATVHPAVAEVIVEVLLDAAHEQQVLITTHSPDILDYKFLSENAIRLVEMNNGISHVYPLASATKEAIKKRLYTPGELLRNDELLPDKTGTGGQFEFD